MGTIKLDEDLERRTNSLRPSRAMRREIASEFCALCECSQRVDSLQAKHDELLKRISERVKAFSDSHAETLSVIERYKAEEARNAQEQQAYSNWRMFTYEPARERWEACKTSGGPKPKDPATLVAPKVVPIPADMENAFVRLVDDAEKAAHDALETVIEFNAVCKELQAARDDYSMHVSGVAKATSCYDNAVAAYEQAVTDARAEMERRTKAVAERIAKDRARLDDEARRYGLT